MSKRMVTALRRLAEPAGFEVVCVSEAAGHYQVRGGALLVNWYPFSAKRTAYVKATKKGIPNASPEQVIQLATTAPDVQQEKVERNAKRAKRAKLRMLKTHPFCHWCDEPLTRETATLEHIIPLKRGGLDHHNNMTLACEKCNRERGHDMPELSKENQPCQ